MKATNILLIIVGAVIFIVSLFGGGLFFRIPIPSIGLSVLWFVGVILVAIGLWLNQKEKSLNNHVIFNF